MSQLRAQAYEFVRNQEFTKAIRSYQKARDLALQQDWQELAIQFLNNIAGCYYSLYAYQDAIRSYRQSFLEARKISNLQLETLAALNMASLYLAIGETKNAADILNEYPLDGSTVAANSRLEVFLIQASVFTKLNNTEAADAAFARAMREAELDPPSAPIPVSHRNADRWSEGPRELRRAWVYAVIGECLNWRGDSHRAEPYILEAFRLRSTYREGSSFRSILQLAMVHRERRDFQAALRLLSVSRHVDPPNRTVMHDFLLDREVARVHLAAGNFEAAFPYLRSALSQARRWRLSVLPTDSAFLNFEAHLNTEIYRSFLDTLCAGKIALNQKSLAEESFWVAEEARFASMRAAQLPAAAFAARMPGGYWAKFAELQKLQTAAIRGDKNASAALGQTERALNRIEMESGLSIPQSSSQGTPAIADWKRNLPADEVVFSYYLAEPFSLAWVADSRGIHVRRIAGRAQLAKIIEQFRAEILNSSQIGTNNTALELTRQLFGDYLYSHHTIQYWTMVVDQELAALPIAALPSGMPRSRFLVEDHTLRIVPSAIALQKPAASPWRRQAVGIADAVYNRADTRLASHQQKPADLLELSRLPASARELQKSMTVMQSNQWATQSWMGTDATGQRLRNALLESPDIIHLSTHFVSDTAHPQLLSIALTPSAGRHSLFSSLDLNGLRTNTKLMVLSGCSSSSGAAVSGIAINGLARACLISGASTVLATLWPTVDSDGPIFPVFYGHLLQKSWNQRSAAESLRAAQLEMIRRGGWSSRPAYWAAYLAISKG